MLESDWYENSRIVVEFGNEAANSTENIGNTFINAVQGTKSSSGKYFSWSTDATRQIFNILKQDDVLTVNATLPKPLTINIKPKNIHLGDTRIGTGQQLITGSYNSIMLSAYDDNDNIISNEDLTWSLSDTTCAEIDDNGLVKPIVNGTAAITTATVTHKTENVDLVDTADIYIERSTYYKCVLSNTFMINGENILNPGLNNVFTYDPSGPPYEVLPPIYRAINKESRFQLTYNIIESEILSEKWTSSHPEILSVEKNTHPDIQQLAAKLTLNNAPDDDTMVTITCDCISEYGGNLSAVYYINVLGINQLKFDLIYVSTKVGSTLSNAATLWFGGIETGEDVTSLATYTSSDTSIARVVLIDGLISIIGVGKGSCTITATYGGKTTTLDVLVKDPNTLKFSPSSITVSNSSVSLESPTTLLYNGTDVTLLATYTSSDTSIATVAVMPGFLENDGHLSIVGKNVGSTTITGSYNGYTAKLNVTVEDEGLFDPDEPSDDDTIGAKDFDVRTKNNTMAGTMLHVNGQVTLCVSTSTPTSTSQQHSCAFQVTLETSTVDGYIHKSADLPSILKSDYSNVWLKVDITSAKLTNYTTGGTINASKVYEIDYISGGTIIGKDGYTKEYNIGKNIHQNSSTNTLNFSSDWVRLSSIVDINTYANDRFGILIGLRHV